MKRESNKVLATSVRKLLRRDATDTLAKIVERTHPADLAGVVGSLTPEVRRQFFDFIERRQPSVAAEVLAEVEPGAGVGLVRQLDDAVLVRLLEHLPPDDTADVLALVIDEERREAIVRQMRREEQVATESLLAFDAESAGGLMSTDFFELDQNMTSQEALEQLQDEAGGAAETVFYLYVVNEHGQLVGVASLRQLVRAPVDQPLREFMITDVVRVRVDTDQEEVARLIARYNLIALPVVDQNNHLVGIVTVDDIIDVIRHEATEDMLLMGGAGDEDVGRYVSPKFSVRTRLPWLFPSFLSGLLAMVVVSYYAEVLLEMIALAALIPVIIGVSGNVGTQSSTIVTRGLMLGRSDFGKLGRVLPRELLIGALLGVAYGALTALIAGLAFWAGGEMDEPRLWLLAAAGGVGMLASMTMAAVLGSVIPMLFKRLNLDPATALSPVVVTAVDVLAVWLYLASAVVLLRVW